MTALKKGYQIVKRPLVQSALTDASERLGIMFDDILKPVKEALSANRVVQTPAGPVETLLPDHRTRMEAHDRLVNLYGGKPKETEMPAPQPPGLVVNIYRDAPPTKQNLTEIPNLVRDEPM